MDYIDYEAMDDDLFLATLRLNNPQAVEATLAGQNECDCERCVRLRNVLQKTLIEKSLAKDAAGEEVDVEALAQTLRNMGLDVTVVRRDDPDLRTQNTADAPDLADNMRADGFDAYAAFAKALNDPEPMLSRDYEKARERIRFLSDQPTEAELEDEAQERAERKATPIASGVIAYFPDALAEVARVSKVGNEQHNPGQPLHWAREKSTDEADALQRHLTDFLSGDEFDTDGVPHLAKVAWRALALLQRWYDDEYINGYHS